MEAVSGQFTFFGVIHPALFFLLWGCCVKGECSEGFAEPLTQHPRRSILYPKDESLKGHKRRQESYSPGPMWRCTAFRLMTKPSAFSKATMRLEP
ncbi:hypothetical protein BF29_454 [Heyndrickxia coagulans DSM 1 = ATCC 7050]|nr:hypothetical protein BF29_454 [Heyndrickxia coagulans DSM 1 = ATCC 7050]